MASTDRPPAATSVTDHPLAPYLAPGPRRARFSHRPRPAAPLPHLDAVLAGAAEVDLTPPPGMPKAGYSANAHLGSGFRTRLRARVLHLRSGTSSIALVQCDLLGGSAVVHHLVAQAIADRTDVALSGLFLGATHTHAGPGQFLGTDFYNRFSSNRSGFDPAFTRWLVERIAGAVVEAVATRAPARLAVGTLDVWGLTRNRSLGPHVRNRTVVDASTEPQRKYLAINPDLHLIRADRVVGDGGSSATTEPLAAMVVFSVHGTGIPMRAHEYNADIWAYLVGELADGIEAATGRRPVVGAMEGTHADVAPALRPKSAGHLEAARVGRAVGREAVGLYARLGDELRDDVALGAGLREIDLDADRSIDGITLPKRPAVGAALLGGAHENETPVVHRIPPFGPGWPKPWASRPHGAKWVLGSRWLQPIVLRLRHFPRVIPVHVLRIGDSMIVGLPFELTVETGRRIAAQVHDAIGDTSSEVDGRTSDGVARVARVIVSSVVDEYAGYVATPEEYELQHYEGAHTLYGPATQPFLAAHAARLAREVVDEGLVQDVVAERRFDLRIAHHLPRPSGTDTVERRFVGPARFVDPTARADGYWEIEWQDVAPANLHWHEPIVEVEAADGELWEIARREGRRVDDRGWDLQVTHLGPGADGHRYAVRWWDPAFKGGRSYRFVLAENAGRLRLVSEPFG